MVDRLPPEGAGILGHAEYHMTSGVETTTGRLGQGCGASVGMAIADLHRAKL
jgi:transketolase